MLRQMEAAELLAISERTFRRWRDRHRDSSQEGLAECRLTPSPRRAPAAEIEGMSGLYRNLYPTRRADRRGGVSNYKHYTLPLAPGETY